MGKGQSVVFCIPEEIRTKISSLPGTSTGSIGVPDVIRWALTETWRDIYRSIPLWAVQGERFERQVALWDMYHDQREIPSEEAKAFLEEESQSLEQRYRPRRSSEFKPTAVPSQTRNLHLIHRRCRLFNDLNLNSAQLHEEQEQELSPEIEREREVQRPPPAVSKDHHLNKHIISFISTRILATPTAFQPVFKILQNTSVANYLDLSKFPPGFLITRDFANTILIPKSYLYIDDYQHLVK